MKSIAAGVVAFVVASLLFFSFHIVPAGHRGVVRTMGDVSPVVLEEGPHFLNPIASVTDVDVRLDIAKAKSSAGTKDFQTVNTEVTVNYRLDGSKVAVLYKEYGLDIEDKIIVPAIQSAIKAVTASYTGEELLTKRDVVSDKAKAVIEAKVAKYGVITAEVQITDLSFSASFVQAVEAKVTAAQQTLKAEQDLARIKIESQQAVARAEAEAASLKAQRAEVTPELIKLREVEVQREAVRKWNGVLPATVAGGSVPFLSIK